MFEKSIIFLQVSKFFFCSCFVNPFFLISAFCFVVFSCFGLLFTSSCCCFLNQVSMFCFLFLLFLVSLVLLGVISWICFVFVLGLCFFEGLRVR